MIADPAAGGGAALTERGGDAGYEGSSMLTRGRAALTEGEAGRGADFEGSSLAMTGIGPTDEPL